VELRLRQLRTHLGMNQRELALQVGCTRAAISHWECGRDWPPMAMIPRLADALGVAEAHLLTLDPRPRRCRPRPVRPGP
jgi:transcriptional regulator with XRE-family HTH domain